ncbi:MAG: tyrosine-type recombinase/integrase, partial [Planctomycetaceae bacterium]
MGTVFKRTSTKPLPVGAELFARKGQRLAKWQDSKGRTRTASVIVPTEGKFSGQERIAVETPTYFADYRDGNGHLRRVATGCKDETAARAVLAGLEKRAEKVRSGIISTAENAMVDHQHTALTDHLAEFIATMQAAGRSKIHVTKSERLILRVIDELNLRRLADIRAEAVERWLGQQTTVGMAARTRNSYLVALRSFLNWGVKRDRLPFNPLAKLDRADERSDRRRQRRALTEAELSRLLMVARLRPLAEYGRETTKTANQDTTTRQKRSRATWRLKPLTFAELPAAVEVARERIKDNPTFLARQERLGIERALAYTIAVTTGLRLGELGSLTVGQVELDGPCPHVRLKAADEKNRQGNTIPLRRDVADELRQWVSGLGGHSRSQTNVLSFEGRGESTNLSPTTKLFSISADLSKVLSRDRAIAGIAKRDDRGRVVDFHALRHTFGTNLSKAGVSPRVAQAAMRHSSIDLTMNVYTDPRLLDVQGAVESLPQISTTSEPNDNRQRMAAGAETFSPSAVAVLVAVP